MHKISIDAQQFCVVHTVPFYEDLTLVQLLTAGAPPTHPPVFFVTVVITRLFASHYN